jgi:hypothetical protein
MRSLEVGVPANRRSSNTFDGLFATILALLIRQLKLRRNSQFQRRRKALVDKTLKALGATVTVTYEKFVSRIPLFALAN